MKMESDGDITGTQPGLSFDFSALAGFDPASVPVLQKQLLGLAGAPTRSHPLGEALGNSCGDPGCRYRAYELLLHRDRRALMENHILAASASAIPPDLAITGLGRDIYRVASQGAARVADLSEHPILYQVPLSARSLRSAPADSPEWELLRILRDFHRSVAIRLPSREGTGDDLIVHADLASTLRIKRLGTLQEVLPILSEGASESLPLSKFLIRLLRSG
jgi:hypothetical protein